MILVVAFPMLVVEMAIGRHGQANPVDSMRSLTSNATGKTLGGAVGWIGLSVPSAVLAFYSIVGGWLICFLLGAICDVLGMETATAWFKGFSVERNLFGTITFYVLTVLIVQGVLSKVLRSGQLA